MANKKSGRNGTKNAARAARTSQAATQGASASTTKNALAPSPHANGTNASAAPASSATMNTAPALEHLREELGISPQMIMFSNTNMQLTFIEALYDCILYELALKKGLYQHVQQQQLHPLQQTRKEVAVRYAQIQMAFAYALAPLISWRHDLYNVIVKSKLHSSPEAVEAFAKTTSALRVKGLYPYNRRAYRNKKLVDLEFADEHDSCYVAVDSLVEQSAYLPSDGEEDAYDLSGRTGQHLGYFLLPSLSKDHRRIFRARYVTMVRSDYRDPIAVIIFALRRLWGTSATMTNEGIGGEAHLVKRDRFGVKEYTSAWAESNAAQQNFKPTPSTHQPSSQPQHKDDRHGSVALNGHGDPPSATGLNEKSHSLVSTTPADASKDKRTTPPSPLSKEMSSPVSQIGVSERVIHSPSQSATSAVISNISSPLPPTIVTVPKARSDSQTSVSAANQISDTQPSTVDSKEDIKSVTSVLENRSDAQPTISSVTSKSNHQLSSTASSYDLSLSAVNSEKNGETESMTPVTSKDKQDSPPTIAPTSKSASQPQSVSASPSESAGSSLSTTVQAQFSFSRPLIKASATGISNVSSLISESNPHKALISTLKSMGNLLMTTTTSPAPKLVRDPQPTTSTSHTSNFTHLPSSASPQQEIAGNQPLATISRPVEDSQQSLTASSEPSSRSQSPPTFTVEERNKSPPPPQLDSPLREESDSQVLSVASSLRSVANVDTPPLAGAAIVKPTAGDLRLPALDSIKLTADTQLPAAPSSKSSSSLSLGSNSVSSSNSITRSSTPATKSKLVKKGQPSPSSSELKPGAEFYPASFAISKDKNDVTYSSPTSILKRKTDSQPKTTIQPGISAMKGTSMSPTAPTTKAATTAAAVTDSITGAYMSPELSKIHDDISADCTPPFYHQCSLADYNGPNPALELYQPQLSGQSPAEFYQILSEQVNMVYQSILPSAATLDNHAELLKLLQKTLSHLHPGPQSQVFPFGSYSNGLLMDDSDADFCIAGDPRENDPALADMLVLSLYLEDMGMQDIQVVDMAAVPIVKFVDPHTKLRGDINYGNRLGVVNSRMIRMYTEIDPRCKKLLYVVKLICRRQGINDSSKGTLSSYALNMMGITFLQNQDPPILPCLQNPSDSVTMTSKQMDYYQRGREGRMVWRKATCTYDTDLERYRNFGKANRKSIGRLVYEFFEFYSRYYDYINWEVLPARGAYAMQQPYRRPMTPGTPQSWTSATTPPTPSTSTTLSSSSGGGSSNSLNNSSNISTSQSTSTNTLANSTTQSNNSLNYSFSPYVGTGTFRVVDPFLPQRNLVGTCRGDNIELVWRTFDGIYKALSEGTLYRVLF